MLIAWLKLVLLFTYANHFSILYADHKKKIAHIILDSMAIIVIFFVLCFFADGLQGNIFICAAISTNQRIMFEFSQFFSRNNNKIFFFFVWITVYNKMHLAWGGFFLGNLSSFHEFFLYWACLSMDLRIAFRKFAEKSVTNSKKNKFLNRAFILFIHNLTSWKKSHKTTSSTGCLDRKKWCKMNRLQDTSK